MTQKEILHELTAVIVERPKCDPRRAAENLADEFLSLDNLSRFVLSKVK